MLGNFDNQFIKIKVVGVNTVGNEKLSGGLASVNYMLEQNLQGVNYLAVDRQDVKNLDGCNTKHKLRLLNMEDERNLVRALRGADMIFIVAENVWENIKVVALTAHCSKKIGAPVIFIAGGNFQDAEDEIIFDALIKLPNENFAIDSAKVIQNFIEAVTFDGQPKIDVKSIAEAVKNSAAIIGYSECEGNNAVSKAAKAALEHAQESTDDFKSVKKILFNITTAKGNFSLEEAEKLSKLFKRRVPQAEVSFGFTIDDWLVKKIKFLLIAAQ